MRTHPDADDAQFGDAVLGGHPFAQAFGERFQRFLRLGKFVLVEGKGDVRGARQRDVLDDHIHGDPRVGDGLEYARGDAGGVGHLENGDFGLVAFDGNATDHDLLHAHGFFFDDGSRVVVE